MERNWLIRTSQNQILGPVAKEKLVEFIKKGALGLTDEVCSGNGYWFYLKEKELVDKYLFGDLPQSYNPISESKTVLALRDNPNKTTSLNAGLANKQHAAPVVSGGNSEGAILPAEDDLDFPDMDTDSPSADITVVANIADLKLGAQAPAQSKKKPNPVQEQKTLEKEVVHLPNADDLEFPDVEEIVSKVKDTPLEVIESDESDVVFMAGNEEDLSFSLPDDYLKVKRTEGDEDNGIQSFPSQDDLDFPDADNTATQMAQTSTKIEKGKVDLSHQYTRTVALDDRQVQDVFPETVQKAEPARIIAKKERVVEERIQLHDRKVKTVPSKGASQRDPSRERAYNKATDSKVEPLKRRNDSYLFYILILLVLIIAAVFYYFKEILNKPLPV